MKHFSCWMRGWPASLLILLGLAGPVARGQAPAWQMALATSPTTSSSSNATATATDANGSVYVVGSFNGSISFGSTVLNSSAGHLYVAKWSPASARYVWAVQAGNGTAPAYEEVTAIAVSGTSVYIGGRCTAPSATFGSISSPNTGGIFIAKLTDVGSSASFTWVQRSTGDTYFSTVMALAVSGTSVYAAGRFRYTAAFGSSSITSLGAENGFVAKLSDAGPTGTFAWAQRIGTDAFARVSAIAANGTAVYLTGEFDGLTAGLGPFTLTNSPPPPSGGRYPKMFVAKLADAGITSSFAWAVQTTVPGYEKAVVLATNGTSVYVGGHFSGTVGFGATTLTSVGSQNIFVTKLTNTGSFVWAQRGGERSDSVKALTLNGPNVYITGSFLGPTTTYGSTTLTNANTTNPNFADVFVANLLDAGSTGTFVWAQQAGRQLDDYGLGVTISGSTIYVVGTTGPAATFGNQAIPAATGTTGFLASLTDPTLTVTAAAQGSLGFSLAPNPARTAATVLLPAQPGAATATLTLRDALGRAVRTETVNLTAAGLRHGLDLSGLPAGLYAVQVRAGAATATRRLVVE